MKREIPDIALTLTPGIGPKGAVHLLDVFGSAEAAKASSLLTKRPLYATPTGTRAGDSPKESVRRRRARSQTLPQTRDRDHRLHRRTIPGPAARNRRLSAYTVCPGLPGSARQDDAYDGRHAPDDSVRATDGRPANRRTGGPGGGYGDRERPGLRHRYGLSPCSARFRHADCRHHRLGPSRHHARTAHSRRPGYDRTRRPI